MEKRILSEANTVCIKVDSNVNKDGVCIIELTKDELAICHAAYSITSDLMYRDAICKTHMLYTYKFVANTSYKNFPGYLDEVKGEANIYNSNV